MASKVQDELKALGGGVRARMSKYNEAIKTKKEPVKKETLVVGTLDEEKKDVTRYHSPKRAAENKKKAVVIDIPEVVQSGSIAALLSTFEKLASKSRTQEERDKEEAQAKEELGKLLGTGSNGNLNTSLLQSPEKQSSFESPTKSPVKSPKRSIQVLSPQPCQSSSDLNGSANSAAPLVKSPVPVRSLTFQSVRNRYMQAIKECKPGFSLLPPEDDEVDGDNTTDEDRPARRHPLHKRSVRKVEAEKKDRFVQLRQAWDKYEIIAKTNNPKIINSSSPEEVAIQKQINAAEDEVVNKWVDYAKAVVAVVAESKGEKKKNSSSSGSTDDSTQEETTSHDEEDDDDEEEDDLSYWIQEAKRMKAEADTRRKAKEEILKRQAEEQARAEAEAEEAYWLQEAMRLKELNKSKKAANKSKKKTQDNPSEAANTAPNAEEKEEHEDETSELINPYDDETVDVLAIAAAARAAKAKALEAARSRPVAVSGVSSSGIGNKPLPAWVKSRNAAYTASSTKAPTIPSGTPFNGDDSDDTEIHHVDDDDDDDVDHHRIESNNELPVGSLLLHQRKKLFESNNEANSSKLDWKKTSSAEASNDSRAPFRPRNLYKNLNYDDKQEVDEGDDDSKNDPEADTDDMVHGKKKKVYDNDGDESDIKANKKKSFGNNLGVDDDDNDAEDDDEDIIAKGGENNSIPRRKKTFIVRDDDIGNHTKERKKKSTNVSGDAADEEDDDSESELVDSKSTTKRFQKKNYLDNDDDTKTSKGKKNSLVGQGNDNDDTSEDEQEVYDNDTNNEINTSKESNVRKVKKKDYDNDDDDDEDGTIAKSFKGKKKSLAGQSDDSSEDEGNNVCAVNGTTKDVRIRKKKVYDDEDDADVKQSRGKKKYASGNGLDHDDNSSAYEDENDEGSDVQHQISRSKAVQRKKKSFTTANDDDDKEKKKTSRTIAGMDAETESEGDDDNSPVDKVRHKKQYFDDDTGTSKSKTKMGTGQLMGGDSSSNEDDDNNDGNNDNTVSSQRKKKLFKKDDNDGDVKALKKQTRVFNLNNENDDDDDVNAQNDNVTNQEVTGNQDPVLSVSERRKKLFGADTDNHTKDRKKKSVQASENDVDSDSENYENDSNENISIRKKKTYDDEYNHEGVGKSRKKNLVGQGLNDHNDDDSTSENNEDPGNQDPDRVSVSERRKKLFGADADNYTKDRKKKSIQVSGNDVDSDSENNENDTSNGNKNVRKKKNFVDEDDEETETGVTKSKKTNLAGQGLNDNNDDSNSDNNDEVGTSVISSHRKKKQFIDNDDDITTGKNKITRGNYADKDTDEDDEDENAQMSSSENRVYSRKKKAFATDESDDDEVGSKANKKKLSNVQVDGETDDASADVESASNTDKRKKKVFAADSDSDRNEQKKKNFGRKINLDGDDDSDDETGDYVAIEKNDNADVPVTNARRKKQFSSNSGDNLDNKPKKKYGRAHGNDDNNDESDNSENNANGSMQGVVKERKKKQFVFDGTDEGHKSQRKKQFGNLNGTESDEDEENEDETSNNVTELGKGAEPSARIRRKKNFVDDSDDDEDHQNRSRRTKKNFFNSVDEGSSDFDDNSGNDNNNRASRSGKSPRKKVFCDDDTDENSPAKGKKKKSLTESYDGESSSSDESDDESCSSAKSKSKTRKKKKKTLSNDDWENDEIKKQNGTKHLKQTGHGVENRTNEGSTSFKDKKKPKNRRCSSATAALAGKSLYDDDSDYDYADNHKTYTQSHKAPSRNVESKFTKKVASPSKGSPSKICRPKPLSTSSDDGSYQKPEKKALSFSAGSTDDDSDSDDSAPNKMQGMAAYMKKETDDESYEDASMSDTVPTDDESVKQTQKPVVPFQKKKTVDIQDDQVALEQKQLNLDGTYWKYSLNKWLNEPSDRLKIVGTKIIMPVQSGTDFWRQTRYNFVQENAPFHYEEVSGDFEVIVHVSGNFTTSYQKAGLMVRDDDGQWIYTGMEYFNEKAYMSMIVTKAASDRTLLALPLNAETAGIWFCIKRHQSLFELYYSFDSKKWLLARQCLFAMGHDKLNVGITSASPTTDGLEVTFNYYRCSNNAIWTSSSTAV